MVKYHPMSISVDQKQKIIKKFAQTKGDTGSPEVQVALLSNKIKNLTHMGNRCSMSKMTSMR